MFIGEYSHSLDEKGRMSVPAKFRDELAKGLILTRGLDGCLWLYTETEWEKIADQTSQLPITQKKARSFGRFLLSGAMDLKMDKIGRVIVPKYLADYAGIKNKVVVIGMRDRLEIWAEDKWNNFRVEMENNSDEVAENLSEFGF
jgi:MraZ protein